MLIAMASDHRGVHLKDELVAFVKDLGHQVEDLGCFSDDPVDYPDLGQSVAEKVSNGKVDAGILICGTGIGMSIVANKFPRVRAALVCHIYTAQLAKEHNNANVLVLGGGVVGPDLARQMVKTWLEAEFKGERHLRRLKKIEAIERRNFAFCNT